MFRYLAIVWIACLAATGLQVEGADRVASGLVVLYDFEEGAGPTIRWAVDVKLPEFTPLAFDMKTAATFPFGFRLKLDR